MFEINYKKKVWLVAALVLFLMSVGFMRVTALPQGPSVNYVTNYSKDSTTPTVRTVDQGGTITSLRLNLSQQNLGWKAYVGNVTGKLTLADANNNSIYDWQLSSFTGEIYTSRNNSISWPNINCSNSTTIIAEDVYLNKNSSSLNSMNITFSNSNRVHRGFNVGATAIANSTCRAIALNNGTIQSLTENSLFQEMLLQDTSSKLVYTTLIESAKTGFNSEKYDFQMIVSEDESASSPTPYYFYVELI